MHRWEYATYAEFGSDNCIKYIEIYNIACVKFGKSVKLYLI